MKILVPGASGLVGAAVCHTAARAGHTVIGWHGRNRPPTVGGAEFSSIDLADANAVEVAAAQADAEVIVNCAALSQPALCEQQPELSRRLNVTLPAVLARIAETSGCRLIHLSSEQVFSGETDRPYRPEDRVAPRNTYGRHKVESEQRIFDRAGSLATVIRPPLMAGNSVDGTRSPHEQMLAAWRAGQTPKAFVDEFRQPCSAENLASVLVELCARPDCDGLFHWGGRELISRYDLLLAFRRRFGLDEAHAPIARQTRAEVPEVARLRPRTLPLDLSALATRIDTKVETLDDMLATLRWCGTCAA